MDIFTDIISSILVGVKEDVQHSIFVLLRVCSAAVCACVDTIKQWLDLLSKGIKLSVLSFFLYQLDESSPLS